MRQREKRKNLAAPAVDVEKAMETLRKTRDAMSALLSAYDLVADAAAEALGYRDVLKDGHSPLSYADTVLKIRRSKKEGLKNIGDALSRAEVTHFRLGSLRCIASNGFDWAAINFAKGQLEEFLQDTYGVAFRVVVNHDLRSKNSLEDD